MVTAESLFEKLKHVKIGAQSCLFTLERCEKLTPLINEINALKAQKNAVILAHSYVSPEIVYGVSDYSGDSYELSKRARDSDAQTIVFSAVKFMADTAKLLSPSKQVLIPSKLNGCTLADSITGVQVKVLRAQGRV
jgi:quinolinate synthase